MFTCYAQHVLLIIRAWQSNVCEGITHIFDILNGNKQKSSIKPSEPKSLNAYKMFLLPLNTYFHKKQYA